MTPTLFGLRVITSDLVPDEVPKIQVRDIKLSDGTSILTPEFRADLNAWLLARFGKKQVAYVLGDGQAIAMSARMKARIEREMQRAMFNGYGGGVL